MRSFPENLCRQRRSNLSQKIAKALRARSWPRVWTPPHRSRGSELACQHSHHQRAVFFRNQGN
jgi:hypothetical protein